ncbi:MAG: CPBP family intramembrane metalloprotease [Raineya sp.]|nr:CPBP family intramembrane metalloprotease [Raineya sp.]
MTKTHPAFNIVIIACIAFGSLVVAQAIGLGVATAVYELNIAEIEKILKYPNAQIPHIREIYWIIQGLSLLLGLGGGSFLYQKLVAKTDFKELNKNKNIQTLGLGLATIVFLCGLPIISEIAYWNNQIHFGNFDSKIRALESTAMELTKILTEMNGGVDMLIVLVVIAVIPAFAEEYLFRGLLQTEFLKWFKNGHIAVWLAAIIFSAIHFQFLGFLPRMILGAFLGYLYLWSGNIWYSITGHFVNNGIQVLALYLYQTKQIEQDVTETTRAPLMAVVIGTILLGISLFLFKKKTEFKPQALQEA